MNTVWETEDWATNVHDADQKTLESTFSDWERPPLPDPCRLPAVCKLTENADGWAFESACTVVAELFPPPDPSPFSKTDSTLVIATWEAFGDGALIKIKCIIIRPTFHQRSPQNQSMLNHKNWQVLKSSDNYHQI